MKKVMKRILVALSVVFIAYLVWDKSFPTVFQTTLRINKLQSHEIEKQLEEKLFFECKELEYIFVNKNTPRLMGMDERYNAYTAQNEEGKEYILIIDREPGSLSAVLDRDYRIAYGLIDNVMLPAYFENGKPWFENAMVKTVSKKINSNCTLECTAVLDVDTVGQEIMSISVESVKLAEGIVGELIGSFDSDVKDNKGVVYYTGTFEEESIQTIFYFVL